MGLPSFYKRYPKNLEVTFWNQTLINSMEGMKQRNESKSSYTSASIESARRFLYDEDEPPPGNPGNTPLPTTSRTNLSARHFGGDTSKDRHRLNPIVVVFAATANTCKAFGFRRFMYLLGIVAGVMMVALGIKSLFRSVETSHHHSMKNLSSELVSAGLTAEEVLKDKSSPQYHALSWLANVDKTSKNDPFWKEKYALAVLFYSTSGTSVHKKPIGGWANQENWMSDQGVCSWYGVECEYSESGPTFDGDDYITSIKLSGNYLVGPLPAELKACEKLITLDLSYNSLTGTLPDGLSELAQLNFFLMGKNSLTGDIPSSYGTFYNLRELDLGHNQFGGTIPEGVISSPSLRKLGLESNMLDSPFPPTFGTEKIVNLYIQDNRFTGTFPISLTKMTHLEDLRLSGNSFTGTIPPDISGLSRLDVLHMSNNTFEGSLPDFFFQGLNRLTELSLRDNKLSSSLPTFIGKLKSLTFCTLANNEFTGSLPMQIGLVSDLEILELQGNQFTGEIPDLILSLIDLQVFRVENNKLQGPLPSQLGALHKLKEVNLSHNQLSGLIPTQLGHLKDLVQLRLEGNMVTGTVPEEVCSLTNNEALKFLSADCGVAAKLECSCCDECF